jgi:hypothetical protein
MGAVLDERPVERVSAYLVAGPLDDSPAVLEQNSDLAFIGSYVLGMGFTFDDVAAARGEAPGLEMMNRLIAKDSRNKARVFPFLGGEEINSSPTHSHHRYVIDFYDRPLCRSDEVGLWSQMDAVARSAAVSSGVVPVDYPGETAADWPDLLDVLTRYVKPIREKAADRRARLTWWQHIRLGNGWRAATRGMPRVIAAPRVSNGLHFTFLPGGTVFNEKTVVVANSSPSLLAALQSRVHEVWVRNFTSTLKDDLNYAPSDCFQNFPLPRSCEDDPRLGAIGERYYDYRAELMVAANEGMTKTYNRFHKESETGSSIQRLRELHDEMDRTVLRAYGWGDLADTLQPEFLTEEAEDDHTYQGRYFWPAAQRDQVLSRLLALNAERYEEELKAGLHEKGKRRLGSDDDNLDEGEQL